MNRSLVTLTCLVFASASAWAFSPTDGLVYDLALVPTDGTVGTANLYDRLTHSAAAHKTAAAVPVFSGDTSVLGTPDPITITNRVGSIPYYSKSGVNNVVYTEPSLEFPQTQKFDGDTLYTYRQGVKFTDMPVSSNMTIYCRLWADPAIYKEYEECGSRNDVTVFSFTRAHGNSSGTNPSYGFSLYLRRTALNDGWRFMLDYGYYNVWGGNRSFWLDNCGRWIDYAITLTTDPVAMTTYASVYTGIDGEIHVQTSQLGFKGSQVLKFKDSNMSLGCALGTAAATDWSTVGSNLKTNRGTFRGGVSRFKIFNRPLSAGEIRGLFTEANGGATVIGTANGSTDEYAVEGEEAAAYNPYTMATSKMRGRLTAEHPTLTIDCSSKGTVKGHHKRFAVTPILDGLAGGSAVVDVAVNGVTVGSLDLAKAKDRVLYIRGRNIDTNGTGCVRYTLTRRAPVTGTLGIDAIEIAGEWQEGFVRDKSVKDATKAITVDNLPSSYVGHPAATNYMQAAIYGRKWEGTNSYRPVTTIEFYVPPDIATNFASRYTYYNLSSDYYLKDHRPSFDTYLNGVKYGETIPSVARADSIVREFPVGTLLPGYNTITISNATEFAEAQQAGGYCAMTVGSHIFSFDPPDRGMVMFIR